MKPTLTLLTAVFLAPLVAVRAAESFPTPAALWKDYDPDKGDFKEEVVKEETTEPPPTPGLRREGSRGDEKAIS